MASARLKRAAPLPKVQMQIDLSRYRVKLAETELEKAGAERLRYRVFVEEMGASAPPASHENRRERDAFDQFFDHLVLMDLQAESSDPLDHVVGAYRLMPDDAALAGRGYYSASEYDLGPILSCRRRAVELGRSCVAAEHRGGPALHLLWSGLAEYVLERDIDLMFGVASFPGTDPAPVAEALAWLNKYHLAPSELRVRARPDAFLEMDLVPEDRIETARALRVVPSLIKAYLRLGGKVGEGAYVDHRFRTIDVCVIMDTRRMVERYREFYTRNATETG